MQRIQTHHFERRALEKLQCQFAQCVHVLRRTAFIPLRVYMCELFPYFYRLVIKRIKRAASTYHVHHIFIWKRSNFPCGKLALDVSFLAFAIFFFTVVNFGTTTYTRRNLFPKESLTFIYTLGGNNGPIPRWTYSVNPGSNVWMWAFILTTFPTILYN